MEGRRKEEKNARLRERGRRREREGEGGRKERREGEVVPGMIVSLKHTIPNFIIEFSFLGCGR